MERTIGGLASARASATVNTWLTEIPGIWISVLLLRTDAVEEWSDDEIG
jgi:hypothetical protein